MYRFRKLYLDVVTKDQDVVIAYLTQTTVLGITIPQALLEVYRSDGTRETHRASSPSALIPSGEELGRAPIRFNLADGPVDLFFHLKERPRSDRPEVIRRGLAWSVVAARAEVEVHWNDRPGRTDWTGEGYADLIQIDHLFRHFEVVGVDWGRVHFRNASVVYNWIRFRDGSAWQIIDLWTKKSGLWTRRQLEAFREERALAFTFEAGAVSLCPVRVLHHGRAIDRERFPSTIERAVIGLTTGPLSETRWLSEAHALIDGIPMNGWAVHESVRAPHLIDPDITPVSESDEVLIQMVDETVA